MLTFEEIYNATPFEDEHGELIPHDKVAKMAAEKWANQRWISVNDALPKQTNFDLGYSDEVLAFSDKLLGKTFVSRYDHQDETWGYERGHDAVYNQITHWMYLPELPL